MKDRVGNNRTKTRTVIILGTKDESSESKKLASISKDSVSNKVSHDKSLYTSDADSSTGSPSKSSTKEQRQLNFSLFEASYTYPLYMQAMMTGKSLVEEQLASMAHAVEKLSKTFEEKDMQIETLVSKLESQNIGETSQANNSKSDQNPQMGESAKVYFSFPTLETYSFSLDGLKMLQLSLICRRSLPDLSLNGSKACKECNFIKIPEKVIVQLLILADMGHKVLNSSAQRRRVESIKFKHSK
ncbi:hypothetical protein ACH5RR_026407 [Cinchona calisaya]|uniref:DUF641 domain-containing protein n=1 Tax=Cinchona calisaya TaxID=153742 RepID=A0ABD2Z5X5_9GENT